MSGTDAPADGSDGQGPRSPPRTSNALSAGLVFVFLLLFLLLIVILIFTLLVWIKVKDVTVASTSSASASGTAAALSTAAASTTGPTSGNASLPAVLATASVDGFSTPAHDSVPTDISALTTPPVDAGQDRYIVILKTASNLSSGANKSTPSSSSSPVGTTAERLQRVHATASRFQVQPQHVYDSVFSGFSAPMTLSMAQAFANHADVAEVHQDLAVYSCNGPARPPSKRAIAAASGPLKPRTGLRQRLTQQLKRAMVPRAAASVNPAPRPAPAATRRAPTPPTPPPTRLSVSPSTPTDEASSSGPAPSSAPAPDDDSHLYDVVMQTSARSEPFQVDVVSGPPTVAPAAKSVHTLTLPVAGGDGRRRTMARRPHVTYAPASLTRTLDRSDTGNDPHAQRTSASDGAKGTVSAAGSLVPRPPVPWGLTRIAACSTYLSRCTNYSTTQRINNVDLYILDTGIDYQNPNFNNLVERRSFVPWETNSYDYAGHGTHTAGTAASLGVGVAQGVRLHALKVLDRTGSGSFSTVLSGLNYVLAQKRAQPASAMVVSMSLGQNVGTAALNVLDQAVAALVAADVTVCVAAGNSGVNMSTFSPAHTPGVVACSAYDKQNVMPSWSNYDASCLGAPGVDVLSFVPGLRLATMSGTSMATPHVAGAVALYLAAHPRAKPHDVRAALLAAATPTNANPSITGVPAGASNVSVYVQGLV